MLLRDRLFNVCIVVNLIFYLCLPNNNIHLITKNVGHLLYSAIFCLVKLSIEFISIANRSSFALASYANFVISEGKVVRNYFGMSFYMYEVLCQGGFTLVNVGIACKLHQKIVYNWFL